MRLILLALLLTPSASVPQQPKCLRVLLAPPGSSYMMRNDTLIVVLAAPVAVGWICKPGATPADTLPPMPPYSPARAGA